MWLLVRIMPIKQETSQVPITKIHWKNLNVILDRYLKIGHLRVLSSIDLCSMGSSLFPNARSRCEIRRSQCSNTAWYCIAFVPFGRVIQSVGEGREKVRRTFQRFASPIVQCICSLFVVTTFVPIFVSRAN